MAETTKISWCDCTINFWWGCTEVAEECDNCYARIFAKRMKGMAWGEGAPRIKIKSARKNILTWDAKARNEGRMIKVFAHSMSDVFDPEVDDAWREELFEMMRQTTNTYFLVLTKRPGLAKRYNYPAEKVWLGTSIGLAKNMIMAERIVEAPALVHWISYEPALGQIPVTSLPEKIRWVVCGGESGFNARRFDLEIGYETLRLCRAREIDFFMKQLGSNPYFEGKPFPIQDRKGDCLEDWPEELRVQEFPL